MPIRRNSRFPNAASVRRRLVFDDDSPQKAVTFSAGECIPNSGAQNVNIEGTRIDDNQLASTPGLSNLSPSETAIYQDLLWTAPPVKNVWSSSRQENDEDYDNAGHEARIIGGYHSDSMDSSTETSSAILYLVFLLCILFIPLSFVPWSTAVTGDFSLMKDDDSVPYIMYRDVPFICLSALLSCMCSALAIAMSCCCFSWLIVYFDSYKPGRIPPTPVSPSKYKRDSGHTFHLSYLMAFLNGLVVFGYYLWLNSESYMK